MLPALCVTPINLYAPPSSLPFLCSIIDAGERSRAAEVSGATVGRPGLAWPGKQENDSERGVSSVTADAAEVQRNQNTLKMDIIVSPG